MEQRKATVLEFKSKNKNLVKLCKIVKISRSCIYLKRKLSILKPPGRPAPGFTINRDGKIIYDEIIINPAGNGECILNVPLRMREGAKLTIVAGKKFTVNGNVRIANQ